MPEHIPLLSPTGIEQLREALTSAGYTRQGLIDRLGHDDPAAVFADPRAALELPEADPLATLLRLYFFWETLPVSAVEKALAPLPLDAALGAGLVIEADDRLRAGVSLHPYCGWWILADCSSGRGAQPLPTDHVLDVGPVSRILREVTVRRPAARALDVGTGGGVQALHLSVHAEQVTATDLSERALRFAATTLALNGLDCELLHGDLLTPVTGRRFDLVVSNPPYIIGPGTATHLYRDSGRPGDRVCAELASTAPKLLTDGGYLQFLANWAHVRSEDWTERVAGWVAGTGCDTWVVQRGCSDAAGYVSHWLGETGQAGDLALRARWLDWFEDQRIEAVGFGLVTMRNCGNLDPSLRIESLTRPEMPTGDQVLAWFERQDWQRRGTDLLEARCRTASDLHLLQQASLHETEGWQLEHQVVRLTGGNVRWDEPVDQVLVELLAACDGTRTLGDHLAAIARSHDLDAQQLATSLTPQLGHLIERNILQPTAPSD